jgi:biotin carboxylase
VAVWVYKKKHGLPWNPTAIMNCQNKLLAADGEKQDELVAYVSQVLDAVGLRFGPCHTEVMFTARGPILIEVNARLHGLQGPRLIELSTGTSKAVYAADAILGGGKLINECYVAPPNRFLYPMKKQCVQLVLICPVQGYLKTPIQDVINKMQLESVVEVLPAVQKGQYVQQTCDLPTSAGQVLMVNESGEQIAADIARIRAAEESGELYQVSKEPLPSSPKTSPVPSPLASPRLQSVEKGENWFVDDELSTEDSAPKEMHIVGLD